MKTREMCVGEKQAILKLRKEGTSVKAVAQALGKDNTTIWNVLEKNKKETTGVLKTRHQTGQPRETTAAEDRDINCEKKNTRKENKQNNRQCHYLEPPQSRGEFTTIYKPQMQTTCQ